MPVLPYYCPCLCVCVGGGVRVNRGYIHGNPIWRTVGIYGNHSFWSWRAMSIIWFFFESQTWEPPVISGPPPPSFLITAQHCCGPDDDDDDDALQQICFWHYLFACFVTYFCTHSLVWMCKLPLEQIALTHLYGCASFHLSKWHEINMWNTKKRVRTEALSLWELSFGGHDLCGGGGGGGEEDSFFTWQNDPSNRTPPAKTNKQRYTSTTELPLPKCPKLSSPCQNCYRAICLILDYLRMCSFCFCDQIDECSNRPFFFFF